MQIGCQSMPEKSTTAVTIMKLDITQNKQSNNQKVNDLNTTESDRCANVKPEDKHYYACVDRKPDPDIEKEETDVYILEWKKEQ